MDNEEKKKLHSEWLKCKNAESRAKAKRQEVEDQLSALYPDFDTSSKTFKDEELGFSTNIKKNPNWKLNQEGYKSIRDSIPADLRPEKIVFELDKKGYEYLKKNYPDIYKIVSEHVEFKYNRPTIAVEKLKKTGGTNGNS